MRGDDSEEYRYYHERIGLWTQAEIDQHNQSRKELRSI